MIGTLEGHTGRITTAAFSPKGKLVATGGFDRTVRVWRVVTRRLLRTFEGHEQDLVWSVGFSPDGPRPASAGG